MVVHVINSKEEFDEFIADSKLSVIDFHATWCGPCKMIAPRIEALSNENTDVKFGKVDVDEVEEVARKCEISAMPTFQFYKSGKKVGDVVGANEAKIKELLMKHKQQ
ncbi:uncharacterized protein LOC132560349 [Ylistrum balloti]|uniref:uncharacterized protein LOC132560349 n=1 Tax=Ylistrum balloti TaxID=509963 RepID=UPI002905970C|nr:uncharacterized protein LOC132560349 [Ylistrum balloti]